MAMSRPQKPPLAKPKPRVVEQRERRAELARTIRVVREAVWRRDQGRCRVCQRWGQHVHHLQYRSRGGRWTTANCVLLCRACHQDVHAKTLSITGADADDLDGLVFERRQWW